MSCAALMIKKPDLVSGFFIGWQLYLVDVLIMISKNNFAG